MTESPPTPQHGTPHGWNSDHLKDYRGLRRSVEDRKLAGVAGGLATHLDVDPTVVRVLLAVLTIFGGAGILLYAAMWLVVPEEGTEAAIVELSDSTRNTVLIVVAALAALAAVGDSWGGFSFPWGLVVVGVVALFVLANRDKISPPPPPQRFEPPPGLTDSGSTGLGATGSAPAGGYPLGYNPAVPPGYPAEPPAWAPAVPTTAPAPALRPRKSGPLLFGPTVAAVALALGALGLYDANGGSVPDAGYPALALAVVGGALVLGAFYGRTGGLPLVGLVAALAVPAAAIAGPTFDGDRDVVRVPVSAAALEDSISVPAGRILVDLTRVEDLDELDGRRLRLDANAGEIVVVVPDGLRVEYDASVDYGGMVDLPGTGEDVDGWNVSRQGTLNRSAEPLLRLDGNLGFGHLELRAS